MKHRAFTLIALLAANRRLGEPAVGRTILVKQTYLFATLRPFYGIWTRTFSFVRYFYGPYSEEIFDQLDTLIFSGLVEVTSAEFQKGRTEARYRITEAGDRVLTHFEGEEIVRLAHDLVWALQSLGVEQATTLCKLVYQEAEFARIFAEHNAGGIGPETKVKLHDVTAAANETFRALAVFKACQRLPGDKEAAPPQLASRELIRIYLQSLARQVHRTASPRSDAA